MFWQGGRESENVEDRRSLSPTTMAVGGGAGVILIGLVAWMLGADPQDLINKFFGGNQQEQSTQADPAQEEAKKFCSVVLAYTEDVWDDLIPKIGPSYGQPDLTYRKPHLVLFTGQVESACGRAGSSVGPFYCPGDEKLYLDLSFFAELRNKYGAPGEFAQAYVIAHEVGHHVQKILGYSKRVRTRRGRLSDSVRLELQADYLAGVWAYHIQQKKKVLEEGDLEKALTAAKAIGDDTLQKRAQGYAVPDSFTHGTSEQRERWFRRGFEKGDYSRETLDRFFTDDDL
jgi:predicted metalloprotease